MNQQYGANVTKMWTDMVVANQHIPQVNRAAQAINKFAPRYKTVAEKMAFGRDDLTITRLTDIIGVIHMRESGFDFDTHLANGDPLTADTIHVPAKIMAPALPPYSWEDAAIAALRDFERGWNVDFRSRVYNIPNTLWLLEAYNGFGYESRGINTPYLWSYTQFYDRGYFGSDGRYNKNLINDECGCAPVLKTLGFTGE